MQCVGDSLFFSFFSWKSKSNSTDELCQALPRALQQKIQYLLIVFSCKTTTIHRLNSSSSLHKTQGADVRFKNQTSLIKPETTQNWHNLFCFDYPPMPKMNPIAMINIKVGEIFGAGTGTGTGLTRVDKPSVFHLQGDEQIVLTPVWSLRCRLRLPFGARGDITCTSLSHGEQWMCRTF